MATTTYVARSNITYKENGEGGDLQINDTEELATWALAKAWIDAKYAAAEVMTGIQACDCEITLLVTE